MKGIARLVPLHCGIFDPSASRYHGVKPEEADWSAPESQIRAVAEFLGALDDEDADADRRPPTVISLSDTCSAWTAKANKTFCDDISEFESYMPSQAVQSLQGVSPAATIRSTFWPTRSAASKAS